MVPVMIDITCDGHVHTKLCHHASGEMEDYVRAAIDRGLKKICFLEHLERGVNYFETTWLSEDDFAYYHNEGLRLKEKYREQISIELGIEVGYNPQRVSEILEFLAQHHWDRIGISYHFLKTADTFHLNMVSRKQENQDAASRCGVNKVITEYFAGVLAAVSILPGTVICHLDAVLRHHPDINFTKEHHALILTILKTAATRNMAIEVNTSGYRHRDQPYPAAWIIREALARGIRLEAASDAHRPEEIGRFFNCLPEFIAAAAKQV